MRRFQRRRFREIDAGRDRRAAAQAAVKARADRFFGLMGRHLGDDLTALGHCDTSDFAARNAFDQVQALRLEVGHGDGEFGFHGVASDQSL